MQKARAVVLALLALLGSSRWASSADIPVRYTVDDRVLRDALAGTTLTFQLFTDSACATTAVHTEAVAVENVTVIARLKRFKAPGAARPTKTAELSQTLTGVNTSGNVYLKVTGTGVTPVGGACQSQAASVQSSSGFSGVVKDVNGNLVGFPGIDPNGNVSGFNIVVGGRMGYFSGDLVSGVTNTGGALYFTTANCSGQAYMFANPSSLTTASAAFVYAQTAYIAPLTGTTISWQSVLGVGTNQTTCGVMGGVFIPPDSCCLANSGSSSMGPPLTADLSALTPPFHVE